MKDKSYRAFPLGMEWAHYLRAKGKRLTTSSYRDYEGCGDKFARYYCDLELTDFEPPAGVERAEEFLDHHWGHQAPRTYNKNHSILSDFFLFQVRRGNLIGNPMLLVDRAKSRPVHRTTFTQSDRAAILSLNTDRRDRIALRLLLDYGLRKGSLAKVQFRHFDHEKRQLAIFTKGGGNQNVRIPQPGFWLDLERLVLDTMAAPGHYLLCRERVIPHDLRLDLYRYPDQPKGVHGMHDWWYRCLQVAGIVEEGVTSGERMHKARHTAGQRLLDGTGNLKAVQKLLGHKSIQTTGDTYTDWDDEQLAASLLQAIEDEEWE